MNAVEARGVFAKIAYRDWQLVLGNYTNGAFWLQWTWRRDDRERKGQRWYVATSVTTSELVGIAWQAVQAEELREARQHFLYRDEALFSECDVDQLSHWRALQKEVKA